MIVLGFLLVGLAVGADIPASWSLIAELAPKGARGTLLPSTTLIATADTTRRTISMRS